MKKLSFLIGLSCFIILNANAQKSKYGFKYPTDENVIYDICFTYNGGAMGIADGKSVKVYSTVTNELIGDFRKGHTDRILSIDISKDSTLLVSGGKDSTVVIWNLQNGELVTSLKYDGIITSVVLSPDNHYLASGCTDNNVFIYDIEENKETYVFSEHTNDITSVKFSPDGKYIASSGGDKLIYIHSAEKGTLVTTLAGHTDWVRDISFNAEGSRLISCGDDTKIMTWNISDLNNVKIYENSKEGFSWLLSVDFDQDNKTYAFGDMNGNALIIGQFVLYRKNVKASVHKILFKPNEGIVLDIAVATGGNGVILINAGNMKSRAY